MASNFLKKAAKKSRYNVNKNYGPDAYGGSNKKAESMAIVKESVAREKSEQTVDKTNEALRGGVEDLHSFGNRDKPTTERKANYTLTEADNPYMSAMAALNPGGVYVPTDEYVRRNREAAEERNRYVEALDAIDTSRNAGFASAGSGTVRPVMNTDETKAIREEWAAKKAAYEKEQKQQGDQYRSVRGSDEYRDRVLGFDTASIPYGQSDAARVRYALDDEFRGQLDTYNRQQGLLENPYDNLKYLSEGEKRDLQYYASRGDYETANKYLDYLQPELNKRMQGIASNEMKKLSEEQPVAGFLANIAASREAGVGVIPTIRGAVNEQLGIYEPVDTNGRAFRAAHMLRDTSEGVGEAAYKAAGGGSLGEFMRDVSQAGLSAAQNASLIPMGATAPLVFMGAQAAGQTALDTLENGGTATQALAMAATNAAIETVTEKIGIDNLFRIARNGSKALKDMVRGELKASQNLGMFARDIGSQVGAEGAEEAVAEIAGNIADAVIMGQNGTFARRVQELMASGMTREKAEAQTLTELYLVNVGKAAGQGAIAGGMLGAGAAGGAFVGRSSYSREAQTAYESVGDAVLKSNITAEQLVQAAAASGNEDAIEAAQRMSAALERGEEPSTADIGRLHLLAGGYISGYQARLAEGGGQNAETEKEAKKDTTSYMSEGENAGNIHDNVSSKGEFASEKNTQTQQGENNTPIISEAKSGADITKTAAQMQQNTEPAAQMQQNEPQNALEEERAEVREAVRPNMTSAMPTEIEETESQTKAETPAAETAQAEETKGETEKPAETAPSISVPDWILQKKFNQQERTAIANDGEDPIIIKETEKAYRLRWKTEYGNIEGWFPKSVVTAKTAVDTAAEEEAGRTLQEGDRVKTKADGEGVITETDGQKAKVKLDDGGEKSYLTRTLTKTEEGEKNGEKENVGGLHDERGTLADGGVREADAGVLAEMAPEDVRGNSEDAESGGILRQEGDGSAGLAVSDDAGRSSRRRSVGDREGGNVPAAGEVEKAEEKTTSGEDEQPDFGPGDRIKTKAGEEGVVRSIKGDRTTIKTDEGKIKTFKTKSLTAVEQTAERADEAKPEEATTEEETAEQRIEEEIKEKTDTALQDPPRGNNFIIPAEGLSLPKGEKARYKANVEAIRLLRKLNSENRFATPDEQEILSKYVGWGGIASAFDKTNTKWTKEYAELKELLTEEEYAAAKRSTQNAHYTEVGVIRGIYKGLEKLGFEGGRLLEPSAGVGHFAGAMPTQTRSTRWTMVELDPITGNIAKYLYPNADVRVQGFEKAKILDNYMDAAISNVPFGNYGIVDKNYPRAVTGSIHNYFFAKALDKVRPGGLVVFITSRFTMDSYDDAVRKYIMNRADLLGAIRLPDTAFKGNAGTDVVTDILILKKRPPNTKYNGEAFEVTNNYHTALQIYERTNVYFHNHPEMVLGEASNSGSMYRSHSLTYKAKNTRVSLEEQIEKAMSNITGRMEYPKAESPEETQKKVRNAEAKGKNGSLSVRENGTIIRNNNGVEKEVAVKSEKEKQRITAIIGIRQLARDLLNFQLEGAPDSILKRERGKLNTAYDEFVKKYGFLNGPANAKYLKLDVDAPFIRALEKYDSKKKTATKADIFFKNTVTPNVSVTHCDTLNDAVAVSLNETGEINAQRIAELLDRKEADVTKELLDTEAAYKDRDGKLVPAFLYLSGSVKAKLKEAETLAEGDKSYQRNVDALRKVIPKDIPYTDIQAQPGATWVPDEIYSQFANQLLGGRGVRITYNSVLGEYVFESKGEKWLKGNASSTAEWGTPQKPFIDLYEALLNNKEVRVFVPGTQSKVVDVEATEAAKEKKKKIGERFQTWLWEDTERRAKLAHLYNDIFNDNVLPVFDGSSFYVNGSNATKPMREHQKNAVYRALMSGGNILLAHKVGAGKTYEMAAIAIKLRQLGLVKKPLFVVPKSLVAQWGNEFLDLFPASKVLVAGDNAFNAQNRKTFINQMATGDYDAIICSQEQFKAIPLSNERQKRFYRDQIAAIEAAIDEQVLSGERKPLSVKRMEKLKASIEAKMTRLAEAEKDEDNIDFEEIGIDGLFVDEAHYYKNLLFQSSMNRVAGLGNNTGSQRAFDLYMKIKYLQELNGGKGICFATATPIMNSVAEMYTMQRYLHEDMLISKGITNFDAWVKQFGGVTTEIEQTEKGKYREINVLSRFKNVPELQGLFRSFADVITKIPGLKIPKMKGGKRITVAVEPSEFQKEYMQKLADRAEAVRSGRVDPEDDNMLKITGEGRKLSYTQRMFDPSLPYEAEGKIMSAVKNIYAEWENSKDIKGTQLVFLDMGVPKAKENTDTEGTEDNASEETPEKAELSIYSDMKNYLVGMGIPAEEIAFIHDAKNDKQRVQLFEAVNEGKVRVLLGSTGKMGVGMNAQKRIVAMHHMDAPWRPGDLEQREGRGLRQGNINDEVSVYVYVTKETIEETMWSRIYRKATFINQIMNGDISSREIKDEGDLAVSAAEIKAIASGNPLLVAQFKTAKDLAKLESLKSSHAAEVASAEVKIEKLKTAIATDTQYIDTLNQDIKARKDVSGDNFNISIDGKSFTERKEAGDALMKTVIKHLKIGEKETTHEMGAFAGFKLFCSSKGDIIIKGKGQYRKEANMLSATGMTMRLEYLVKGLDEKLKQIEQRKRNAEKDLKTLESFVKTPFAKEAELAELRQRAADIERQLTESAQEQTSNETETEPEESAMYSAEAAARWNAERTNKANEAKREVKPISAIIEEMQNNFDIQLTQGHIRGNKTLGRYNRRNKGIRIKNANDLVTAAHELGHALDDRYSLKASVKADSEAKAEAIRAFEEMPQGAKKKYGKGEKLTEGIAEYVRQFLSDRQTTEAEYPALTKTVLEAMSPKELAQFEQLADDINNALIDTDTATSAIRFAGEETLKERAQARLNREAVREWWDKTYQKWVDQNHAIKRFDRELGTHVYRFATNAAYSDARAKSLIEGGLYDMDGNYIGEGLATALRNVDIADKKTYRLFGEYLVVKHGPERLKEGMDVFSDPRKNTEEFMRRRETELAEEHPEFVEAAEKLYTFQSDFLVAWGVESGLVSAEKAQEWAERWSYYVPFQRYIGDKFSAYGAKRGFANQNSPYKKARGSTRDIIHPVDGIINNIIRTVNAGVRNDVFSRLTEAADTLGADAAILEKIPPKLARQVTNISQIKKAKIEQIWDFASEGYLEENAAKMGEEAINMLDDLIVQYGRGKAVGNVVTVLKHGQPEYWKINDPQLLDALTNMAPSNVSSIIDAYGVISRFITSNLTGMNVVWSIFSNMPRDIATALMLSKSHNPVKLIQGMGSSYINKFKGDKADPLYKEFLAMGGGNSSIYSADHDVAKKERLNIVSGRTAAAKKVLARKYANPLYTLEFVSNMIEAGPRFATYKTLREAGIDAHEAFYEAMDVTTNFRRGGQYGKQTNKVVPFFNAGVQGLDRFARWLTADDAPTELRKKTALRRTLMWIAVSAALAAISYGLNHGDDDREKDYEKLLSTYTKNNFFIIPCGEHKYFAIPKPREIAALTSFFERVLEAANGNKKAFNEFYDYFTDQCLPPLASELAKLPTRGAEQWLNVAGEFGIIGVGAYLGANKDFLGRPIVSQTLSGYEAPDQYTERTSAMAVALGRAFHSSPVQIDFFLKNTLGGFWKTATAIAPVEGKNRDLTGGVYNTYVKDPLYSTDIVDNIYDVSDESARHAKSNPDDMDAQIQKTSDARMKDYYSRFYSLEKDWKKSDGEDISSVRREVLIELSDYLDARDEGLKKQNVKLYNAIKTTGDASLLPAVMQDYVKDANKEKHTLTPAQYVKFQGMYNAEYYRLAAERLGTGDDEATLKAIKKEALETATARMLALIGK